MKKLVMASLRQEDIDKGNPRNCSFCPYALALQRAAPEYSVIIGIYHAFLMNLNNAVAEWYVRLPEDLSHRIQMFDIGEPIHPHEFSLDFVEYNNDRYEKERMSYEGY